MDMDDPFFRLTNDSEWNACIGPQSTEENYVDGYMEAAIELASAVIDKKLYSKRDTLVMPILYNARHAIELSLKFAIRELCKAGVIVTPHPKNHDIRSHWALIDASPLGDEDLRQHVSALEPYISSLSKIDDDGQELRYSENRDEQKSLADYPLANIDVIRTSLGELNRVITALKYRVFALADERKTGSFTAECSRSDLLRISKMLPQKSDWGQSIFTEAKANVMKRLGLSSRKFSQALDIIQANREMGSVLGLEFALAHLSDQNALFVVEQWCMRHPVRKPRDNLGLDYFGERDRETIVENRRVAQDVNQRVVEALTPDEIADLEVIFYIGRERLFCESYEAKLSSTQKEHRLVGNLLGEVDHLMEKTNFLEAVARGITILGRPALARKLLEIRPDIVSA
jgi:hypothetical protein